MHLFCRPAIAAALIALSHTALAQVPAIPDSLEALEIGEADTLQKMRACNPRVDQAALDGMLQKLAKNDAQTLTSFVGEHASVVEKGGLWICVPMSAKRFPVLAVDTLGELAKPQGADPERLKTFHQAIARSLAETGFSRALVNYANTGNANVLFFAVSPERPGEIAFENRFLKKGEFNPDEYPLRLDDANVRSITTAGGSSGTRHDVFYRKYPARSVVDGYLIRKGNERTRRFDFAGTTWKSANAPATSFAFQKEGVVVYRSKTGTSFGSWKTADGVLYFEINKYSYYSALLDDQDYLNAEARNTPPVGTFGAARTENRFKLRLFQEGNAAAEKAAQEKLENGFKTLQALLNLRKNEILAESAEDEQRQQASGRKFQTLCEGEMLAVAMTLADQKGVKTGDLCLSFAGTRADWKSTILKDGCQGRCLPF